jgi:hypothetical protein
LSATRTSFTAEAQRARRTRREEKKKERRRNEKRREVERKRREDEAVSLPLSNTRYLFTAKSQRSLRLSGERVCLKPSINFPNRALMLQLRYRTIHAGRDKSNTSGLGIVTQVSAA